MPGFVLFNRKFCILIMAVALGVLSTGCGSKEAEVVRMLNKYWSAVTFDESVYLAQSGNPFGITSFENDFECKGTDYSMGLIEGEQYTMTVGIEGVENNVMTMGNVQIHLEASGGLMGRDLDERKPIICQVSHMKSTYSASTGSFISQLEPLSDFRVDECTFDGEDLDSDKLKAAFEDSGNYCDD